MILEGRASCDLSTLRRKALAAMTLRRVRKRKSTVLTTRIYLEQACREIVCEEGWTIKLVTESTIHHSEKEIFLDTSLPPKEAIAILKEQIASIDRVK